MIAAAPSSGSLLQSDGSSAVMASIQFLKCVRVVSSTFSVGILSSLSLLLREERLVILKVLMTKDLKKGILKEEIQ